MRFTCSLILSAAISSILSITLLLSSSASAQGTAPYPSRAVTIIAATGPGGPTDQEARLYASKISGVMGQQFILDFKPGGGSATGTAYVAKSKPDGYTLLVLSSGFTTIPALYKDLSFDTIKDFSPISVMSTRTTVLLVHPSFPAKTFADYIAYAKANPEKINFGTSSAGGGSHLAGAWLHNITNTKVTFVHYKGAGALTLDLLTGRVDVATQALVTALPMMKAGKLRALGVTNAKRSHLLPDLPTIAEQNVPGFSFETWLGFSAPSATPIPIINRLSDEFAKIAKMPDVAGPLEANGSEMIGSTPAQFKELIIAETNRWRKVVQDNGIVAEE